MTDTGNLSGRMAGRPDKSFGRVRKYNFYKNVINDIEDKMIKVDPVNSAAR